jgi:hypothetical protein
MTDPKGSPMPNPAPDDYRTTAYSAIAEPDITELLRSAEAVLGHEAAAGVVRHGMEMVRLLLTSARDVAMRRAAIAELEAQAAFLAACGNSAAADVLRTRVRLLREGLPVHTLSADVP